MGSLDVEWVEVVVVAPAGEDPQIGGVAGSGTARVAGEKCGDRDPLGNNERIVVDDDLSRGSVGVVGSGHGGLLGDPASRRDGINAPTNTTARAAPPSTWAAAVIGCHWKGRDVARLVCSRS